jgi:hypothetical protein
VNHQAQVRTHLAFPTARLVSADADPLAILHEAITRAITGGQPYGRAISSRITGKRRDMKHSNRQKRRQLNRPTAVRKRNATINCHQSQSVSSGYYSKSDLIGAVHGTLAQRGGHSLRTSFDTFFRD